MCVCVGGKGQTVSGHTMKCVLESGKDFFLNLLLALVRVCFVVCALFFGKGRGGEGVERVGGERVGFT